MRKALTLLLALSLLAVSAAQAAKPLLRTSGPIDRGSDTIVWWCPQPFDPSGVLEFTSNGPEVTIVFIGETHRPDGAWMDQRIDNVVLLERKDYEPFVLPVDGYQFECQVSLSEGFFFHDVPAKDIVFLDTFAAMPDPRWDLSDGAFYVPNSSNDASAPNDLSVGDAGVFEPSGGSLGLGRETDPVGLATTEIVLTGLEKNKQYVLHFWYKTRGGGVDEYFMPLPPDDLVVDIFGTDEAVATESRSWGGVKALFENDR